VHFGQHNHDLCDEVSQDIIEKWQVEAMKVEAKDPNLTASAFTQKPGQTGNPAEDGMCRSGGRRPGFRRVSKHVETGNLTQELCSYIRMKLVTTSCSTRQKMHTRNSI
jgi:hypothetical protein